MNGPDLRAPFLDPPLLRRARSPPPPHANLFSPSPGECSKFFNGLGVCLKGVDRRGIRDIADTRGAEQNDPEARILALQIPRADDGNYHSSKVVHCLGVPIYYCVSRRQSALYGARCAQ